MLTMLPMLALLGAGQGPQPVVMAERPIGPPSEIIGGTTTEIKVGEYSATLFIPNGWKPTRQNVLWVHFHSPAWYVVGEYQRGGCTDPIAVFNLGQGSTIYGAPFVKVGSFQPWMDEFEKSLGGPVTKLNFTSFSAGFGSVRNLIQDPKVLGKLNTVISCDSIYGSIDSPESRRVIPEHVAIWKPLMDRALARKTTWICCTSQIRPETYAGSYEVVLALVDSIGGTMTSVEPGSMPAANGSAQTLLRTFQRGRLFFWSYDGTTPEAHMTHARRLAELIQESKK